MLQREAAELRRKELDLERQLRMLPAKMEARRTKEKELRAQMSSPAISLNGTRGPRSPKPPGKRRPLAGRETQNAQIKSLVLFLILATIVLLLWRALP